MIYLGQNPIGITTEPNVSGKADKVANATNGNFAALDSNGNLTDSGHSNADYVQDVQINGVSILSEGVANIPSAGTDAFGLVRVGDGGLGVTVNNSGILRTLQAYTLHAKGGTDSYRPITPEIQHASAFYGLAKAAGADMASSSNAVGTYTDEAKAAIQAMLGTDTVIAPKEADLAHASQAYAIGDVFMANGKLYVATAAIAANDAINVGTDCLATNISEKFVKKTDYPNANNAGVLKIGASVDTGLKIMNGGTLYIQRSYTSDIKNGTNEFRPIVSSNIHEGVFYGLAKAASDTTQASSGNAVGTYTDDAKTAIQTMLGVESGVSFVEQVTGTTPVITGIANTRYVCGEVTSISITPPATGIIDVTFTSGTTPAVLTIPNTVIFPAWFDHTTLDANKVYEINIVDGVRGVVTTW